jgi:Tol biopolymer transport system component
VDGKEEDPHYHVSSVAFRPGSNDLIYVAGDEEKNFVVENGETGKRYDDIGASPPTFSPDGKRMAYAAVNKMYGMVRAFIVLDGEEMKHYEAISARSITFSPDGKRLAFSAAITGNPVVVVDGENGKRYSGFVRGSLVFSPDSSKVAYVARQGNKRFVVLNGIEGEKHDNILKGLVVFRSSGEFYYLVKMGDNVYRMDTVVPE